MVNGRPAHDLSVLDRSLHYGDGLFETLRLRGGHPCQWQRHLDRLALGAQRLGIPLPDPALLASESAFIADGVPEGVLKLILTRGSGGRGYRPPATPEPSRVLLGYPLRTEDDSSWRQGIAVRYCHTPVSVNPALAGIKHLNRLDAVLARQEWSDERILEGLMLDPSGAVIGGTMTNLFAWDGTRLCTPCLDECGIAGTVRGLVLEIASEMGIDVRVTRLTPEDLAQALGLFLTNAIIGIWPVRRLGEQTFDLENLPWPLIEQVYESARTPG